MGVTGPSRCASCDEPLEPGDNYCGFCGADVVVPAGPGGAGDRPTVPLGGAPGRAAGPPPGAVPPAGPVTLPASFLMPEARPAPPYGPDAAYGAGVGAGAGAGAGHHNGPAYAPGATHPADPARVPHAPVPAPGYAPGGPRADAPSRIPHTEASVPPSPHRGSGADDTPAMGAASPDGAAGPYGGRGEGPAPHGGTPDPRVVGYDVAAQAAERTMNMNESGSGSPSPEERGGPTGPLDPARPTGPAQPAERPAAPAGPPAPAPTPPGAPAEPTVPMDTTPPASPEHQTPAQGTRLCAACHAGAVAGDGYCENCGHAQPRERDHMEQELPGVAAVSDRGHRHHRNEDFFAVAGAALPDGSPAVLAVVCDGVSSATRPDDASAAASGTAARSLLAALPVGTHPQRAMHDAIIAAAKAVNALAAEPRQAQQHDPYRQQNAPACTIVGTVVGGGLLVVGWVGDSRAYWIPDDRSAAPVRLTEDDSWAAQMVANNLMSEAEAYADDRAHAITGWLGADAYELEPHTASFKPDGPGVVVVCTDGLWNYAEAAAQLAAVLPADAHARPLHSARTLVAHALAGGGHDNVTVAVVPFPAPRGGAGSA
ncbi:protein phosphatase 2C domain-containing protein [Streptomyces sp. NPDC017056]|uniref:protein phosphatase 2C domain-containing protein n=1 Tax=Streptomyces sp. NPDC017056 TaxID=3364973 RepID=UPI0037B0EF9D